MIIVIGMLIFGTPVCVLTGRSTNFPNAAAFGGVIFTSSKADCEYTEPETINIEYIVIVKYFFIESLYEIVKKMVVETSF